jgi:8-hydroxy-5-deazaflavin:NADPH oxidoreductase
MRFAVLGTGMVGRAIAAKLASLGHEVVVGTRDPQATLARTEPDFMGTPPYAAWHAENPAVALRTFAEAAAFGEMLVNTTAGATSLDALTAAGSDNLAGKVLIDIANPLDFSAGMPPSLNPVSTDSLGEQIQRAFPEVKVVKTLNTMPCLVMVEPSRVPGAHDVFVCGEDADAKKQATELLLSFGWPQDAILDLGGIQTARGTEMTLGLTMPLMGLLGHTDFNFRIQGAH